jgi:site-specific DNA-cytosine methylase
LFSGCGGISLGFYSTGKFKIAGAIDFDEAAIKTFKLNFPEAKLLGLSDKQNLGLDPRCRSNSGIWNQQLLSLLHTC